MKHKKSKRQDYKSLERGIFIKITIITSIAIMAVILLRNLTRGNVADSLVAVFQRIFNMDYQSASTLYHVSIRSNLDYIMYAVIAVFFVILSRFLLVQFSKYFEEISNGLDVLVEDKGGEIELSPEMAAMERKLTAIKRTLNEREHEAKLAEQHKNDMVMYLAHDIKTPLTSVIGYLELLDEASDMSQEQKAKYVNISLEKAHRLERLVEEFFEITRYSFQADLLSKESIDLYYMLTQMTDEFYPVLAAKGKQAILHVPEDMIIYGDPNKIARVFNNVLKNAVAYSPDNSVIDITLRLFLCYTVFQRMAVHR